MTPELAAEGSDEHWSSHDAEAILYQLANAFFADSAVFTNPGAVRAREPSERAPEPEIELPVRESVVLVVDEAGEIVSAGGAVHATFGLSAEALRGTPLANYFLGGVPPSSRRALGLRSDGSSFAAHVTVAQIHGWRLTQYAVQDLTEDHARVIASLRAEARYRTLVEQIPAVTFMASLEEGDSEIYIGPQIEALLGYTQAEWLEDPVLWFQRMHPDDQGPWNAEFARGCAVGGPFRADCRFFAKSGRTVWVHGEARVVRDREGRPLFIQGVAFDITDIKEAEAQMREAQASLVRTEKLAAIGGLAASVGHELRNPLAAIRNAWFYLDRRLIQKAEAPPDERVLQFSRVITSEIDRCAKIIGELLDFSRERAVYRVPTPARELVQSALAVIMKPADTIELVNAVSEDLPVPNLDADQFRQVLVNLLQNAAEAVSQENGRVEVNGSQTGGELVLTVSDNGKGMSEDVRARIFEPLYTTKLRGTGLGLAIVDGIIKRHGGHIEVASTLGRGTTFRIRVPLGEASREAPPDLGGAADLRGKPFNVR